MKDVVCVSRDASLASQVSAYSSSVFCRKEIARSPLIMKSHFDFSAMPLLNSNREKRERTEEAEVKGESAVKMEEDGEVKMEMGAGENGFTKENEKERERVLFGLDTPVMAKWYSITPHYEELEERGEERRPMWGECAAEMAPMATLPLCDIASSLTSRATSESPRGLFQYSFTTPSPSSPLSPSSSSSSPHLFPFADCDSSAALLSALIPASQWPDDVSTLFLSPSLSPLLRPFGPYDVATFCSLHPQTPCCSVRYGEAGACVGMTSSTFGTLTWLLVRSGTVRMWIVPSR